MDISISINSFSDRVFILFYVASPGSIFFILSFTVNNWVCVFFYVSV